MERQRLGEDVIGYAHALKVEALAGLGELLKKQPKATGTRGQLKGRGVIGGASTEPPIVTLAEQGLDAENPVPKRYRLLRLSRLPRGAIKGSRKGTSGGSPRNPPDQTVLVRC